MSHAPDSGSADATPKRRGVVGVILRDAPAAASTAGPCAEGDSAHDASSPSARRHAVEFLVIRRSQHVVAPGMYCFPGGGIHEGESEREALVRELQEELHIDAAPQQRIWESVTPWGVQLAWWACPPPASEPIPNPDEVETFHWLTAGEMSELADLLESNRHFLAALQSGEIRWPLGS